MGKQLTFIGMHSIDHASRAPQLMSWNYYMHVGECRCVNVYSYLHANNINQEQFSPDFKSISKLHVFLFFFSCLGGGGRDHIDRKEHTIGFLIQSVWLFTIKGQDV